VIAVRLIQEGTVAVRLVREETVAVRLVREETVAVRLVREEAVAVRLVRLAPEIARNEPQGRPKYRFVGGPNAARIAGRGGSVERHGVAALAAC
jgi:hypothetical protein